MCVVTSELHFEASFMMFAFTVCFSTELFLLIVICLYTSIGCYHIQSQVKVLLPLAVSCEMLADGI